MEALTTPSRLIQDVRQAGPDFRPFAWAGYQLPMHEDLRLVKVTGDFDRGTLTLADSNRPRVELAWGRVHRRKFEVRAMAVNRLVRALASRTTRTVVERDTMPHRDPHRFDEMFTFQHEDMEQDHYVGYCEHTKRMVHLNYRHENGKQLNAFRKHMLPAFEDQPLDEAQVWAFFHSSFLTPPGYTYMSSKLNVGDMAVTVRKRIGWYRESRATVRLIYPGKLAVKRMTLDGWQREFMLVHKRLYNMRWAGWIWNRKPRVEPVETSRGEGATARGTLRYLARPFLWRWPTHIHQYTIHDPEADRLIHLELGHRKHKIKDMLEPVLGGLYYARELQVPPNDDDA